MADKTSKKEVKPADKKVGDLMERHPQVQNNARHLFRNENGTTIVQERVPRGDLPQKDVISPRNEFDLTEDDLKGLADHAKKMVDPTLAKYDEDVANEDAVAKAVWSKDGGKYQGKVSASTQKLILETMKGGKKKTEKKAAEGPAPDPYGKAEPLTSDPFSQNWFFANIPQGKLPEVDEIVKRHDPSGSHVRAVKGNVAKMYNQYAKGDCVLVKKDSNFDLSKMWAELRQGGFVKVASDDTAVDSSSSIDSLVNAIPTSMADIQKSKKTTKTPPKEAGMDKEMLRKEANDLAKKLDALKILLGEDEAHEEHEKSESAADEAKEHEKDACKDGKPQEAAKELAPEAAQEGDKTVIASLDEIAEMVEKEAHDKQDMDLFRIAYQIDCVSDYLGGTKDAAALQTDPDENFMRQAFKSGVNEHDADEPYMKEFSNDNTKETSRVVGNISVQHKTASTLPYAVKKDA